MTGGTDDAGPTSRWRALWTFLKRIEAAAAVTADDLRDERLDRHDRRLAALEAEIGAPRRADAAPARPAHREADAAEQGKGIAPSPDAGLPAPTGAASSMRSGASS